MSETMSQEQLEAVMGLIINAGNAKSDAMEAIQAAKDLSLIHISEPTRPY